MTEILAKGTATITAGLTSVVVAHGLTSTPDVEDIGLTPQDDLEGLTYWASDPDATNFTINISGPAMVDHVFGWFIVDMSSIHGTATVLHDTISIAVTHTLGVAPSIDDIILTPQDDLSGLSYYPSLPTLTTFTINISGPAMIDHAFTWFIIGVTVIGIVESDFCDKVRHKINADEDDVSDTIVLEYVADAVAYVQSETGASIDYLLCTALEEVAIKDLAALDCYCYLFGGDLASISSGSTTENTTNMGYNLGDYGYRVGDASRNLVNNGTVIRNLDPAIQIIKEEFDRAIEQLKLHLDVEVTASTIAFVSGESD